MRADCDFLSIQGSAGGRYAAEGFSSGVTLDVEDICVEGHQSHESNSRASESVHGGTLQRNSVLECRGTVHGLGSSSAGFIKQRVRDQHACHRVRPLEP